MTHRTQGEFRQQRAQLEDLVALTRDHVAVADQRRAHDMRRLGHVLIRERIGVAVPGEMENALAEWEAEEKSRWELQAIAMALPEFMAQHADGSRSANERAATARRKRDAAKFEAARKLFDRDYAELSTNEGTLKDAAAALFELARKAGKVAELRKYFKKIRGRNNARVLKRF